MGFEETTRFSFERNNSCSIQDDYRRQLIKAGDGTADLEPGYLSEPELSVDDQCQLETSPLERHSAPVHLPKEVLAIIASYVLENSNKTCAILALLPMCGVCRHWRAAASHLRPEFHLHFDGSKQMNSSGSEHEQRYRKLPVSIRGAVMQSAAGLFRGYEQVTISGDAITDRMLTIVARNAPGLRKVTLSSCPQVTDIGVSNLALQCPDIDYYAMTTLSPNTSGQFLRHVFELPKLQHLELNTPLLDLSGHKCCRVMDMREWTSPNLVTTLKLLANGLHTNLAPESQVFRHFPHLLHLELDSCPWTAANLKHANDMCPNLLEVHIMVEKASTLDNVLPILRQMPSLKILDIIVDRFFLQPDQLRQIGALRLDDLRLVSQVFNKQPSLARLSCSHLDNSGIKALVDAVCERQFQMRDLSPLKLSICGASSISHDAVSALLRLPVLIKLNINGCNKINAMDKMRLIAKVKAGREQQNLQHNPMLSASSNTMRMFSTDRRERRDNREAVSPRRE